MGRQMISETYLEEPHLFFETLTCTNCGHEELLNVAIAHERNFKHYSVILYVCSYDSHGLQKYEEVLSDELAGDVLNYKASLTNIKDTFMKNFSQIMGGIVLYICQEKECGF
ncbi:hypothetical protein RF11_11802 [Thelohanellus kitauei]|uniref:Uncharacterized protein n=1 Tax=Thelohanellus kitauei TaxID=669202 RepID=A0A0C2MRE7_THEKT|nr:hypothetical protein RF11_11802 [Thelohanellus kitauei]